MAKYNSKGLTLKPKVEFNVLKQHLQLNHWSISKFHFARIKSCVCFELSQLYVPVLGSKTTSQSSADRVMPETAVMQLPQECQRENCHTTYVLLNYYPGSTLWVVVKCGKWGMKYRRKPCIPLKSSALNMMMEDRSFWGNKYHPLLIILKPSAVK